MNTSNATWEDLRCRPAHYNLSRSQLRMGILSFTGLAENSLFDLWLAHRTLVRPGTQRIRGQAIGSGI
jgi:hypothetical protein